MNRIATYLLRIFVGIRFISEFGLPKKNCKTYIIVTDGINYYTVGGMYCEGDFYATIEGKKINENYKVIAWKKRK